MTREEIRIDLAPGSLWDYRGGGRYRVLKVVRHVHSGQQQVAYEGVGGPDDGLGFAAPLWDFATKFTPVAETA